MTALLIVAGSIVGLLAALGLAVVVRVVLIAVQARRLTLEDRQKRLNDAQAAIVRAQKTLAAQRRAEK